jgi:uncharacterized protein YhdP
MICQLQKLRRIADVVGGKARFEHDMMVSERVSCQSFGQLSVYSVDVPDAQAEVQIVLMLNGHVPSLARQHIRHHYL